MHVFTASRSLSSRTVVSLLLFLLLSPVLVTVSAIPTWYNVGSYVVYSSEIEWITVSTIQEAGQRWRINMTGNPNLPILVEPFYTNASLAVVMAERIGFSATWRVIEYHDVVVVVRNYPHEVRTYSDTRELARFEIKNAVWSHDSQGSYPDLFIGFDPVYLDSNPTFTIANMLYRNLGIEDVETPWGVRRAYHLVGENAEMNQTWHKWCDIVSGITLKSDLRQDRGTFGNLRYYESYREKLVIKETNIDITVFQEEPWYQISFYGIPLWLIIVGIGCVVAYLVVRRMRTKPIEF